MATERARRSWPAFFGSVRFRLTLTAMVVVAVTLVAGSASLLWLLDRAAVDGAVSTASAEAQNVADLVGSGAKLNALPVRTGTAVQVVDAHGTVLYATPDLDGRPAVASVHPPVGTQVVLGAGGALPDDDGAITVATTVASPSGDLTVYSVTVDSLARHDTHDLAVALAVLVPLLVLASGAAAWLLADRALRPVEAIRAEVAEVSSTSLDRRVPVPPFDDEIARLARTMNDLLARLQAADDQQRRFVSDASHELRSPLAALMAQVEVARAHVETADWEAVAAAVADEGARLGRLIEDLLLLAKGDEGALVPGTEDVDLDELALAEGRRLRDTGRVAVDLSGVGAGRVRGDRDQLRRVVRNLADNAERHAAGTVAFGVRRHDGWVDLTVSDDGPGIPPEERTRVFERFARLDEGRGRPTGGTGLGLAIVGAVAESHGGRAYVGEAGPGATLVVSLPAEPDRLERAGVGERP